MLSEMVNDYEVGIYSAVLRLSGGRCIIPAIGCNSFFPFIIKLLPNDAKAI